MSLSGGFEPDCRHHVVMRRPVDLGVGIDEVVERVSALRRSQDEVAPGREFDTMLVMRAEEVLALRGILGAFGRVDRHPADTTRVELRPAMVALNGSDALSGGTGSPMAKRAGMPSARQYPMKMA